MQYLMLVVGLIVGMVGLLVFLVARTSIHEIQGGVLLIVAAVLVSAAAVVHAIQQLRKDLRSPKS